MAAVAESHCGDATKDSNPEKRDSLRVSEAASRTRVSSSFGGGLTGPGAGFVDGRTLGHLIEDVTFRSD